MELATKGIAQLAELFKSMTPGARVTAALLLVVTLISVTYLFNQQVAPAHVYLMDGEVFSPAELRDMQAAFGKAGLEAESDGARIKIPRGQESKYMAALADADALPAESGHYMQQAVSPGGFLPVGHSQREAAWLVARQQELQRIIGDMRGIERAAVQIDQQETDGFAGTKKITTAAVFVFPDGGRSLDRATVHAIRQSMVSSVSGLEAGAVSIVDMSTNAHFSGSDDAQLPSGDYADQKKRGELEWKQTISEVLAYIPGVLVSTSVELDSDAGSAGTRSLGAPKRVTASVAVPHTYYEQVWRKEHVQSAPQAPAAPDAGALAEVETREKAKIEQLVANLLPRDRPTTLASPQVAVSTFYPLTEPATTEQALRDKTLVWLAEHWRTVSLGGLALVGLAVLRSMFASIGGGARPRAAVDLPPTLSLVGDDFEETAPAADREPLARPAPHGSSLSHELAEAVRDDPEAAVSVLRTWIGNAS